MTRRENSAGTTPDRIAGYPAGIAFVICGNIMPKSDRNEAFGLRTPWSLSNDEVWRKSQRFGGDQFAHGGRFAYSHLCQRGQG